MAKHEVGALIDKLRSINDRLVDELDNCIDMAIDVEADAKKIGGQVAAQLNSLSSTVVTPMQTLASSITPALQTILDALGALTFDTAVGGGELRQVGNDDMQTTMGRGRDEGLVPTEPSGINPTAPSALQGSSNRFTASRHDRPASKAIREQRIAERRASEENTLQGTMESRWIKEHRNQKVDNSQLDFRSMKEDYKPNATPSLIKGLSENSVYDELVERTARREAVRKEDQKPVIMEKRASLSNWRSICDSASVDIENQLG